MLARLRTITKTFPLLLTAFLLALAVWVMAVSSSDPSLEKAYPNGVPVEIIGQGTNLVITTEIPGQVLLSLRAPSSIWENLISEKVPVRALIDLSGLGEGVHTVPIQIQIGITPVEVRSYNPRSINLTLEPLDAKTLDIRVINLGSLAMGFQSNPPELSESKAIVSGAKTQVDRVAEVRAVVNLTDVKADINEVALLEPVDVNGVVVKDVGLSPNKITISEKVFERGGYRNVVVKVVTTGRVVDGFHLTNLSVYPPTVTVYSTDPALVDALPGYVETQSINLNQKKDSFDISVDLNLPAGVQVIDSTSVLVNVGISPIQSSLSLTDILVETSGLAPLYKATILPEKVNLILSGPLSVLDALNIQEVRVQLDLSGMLSGSYTLEPKISLNVPNLVIESINPTTFVITIE
ncbi:MAG: CdaR family protein [Chloroflexi bacterium]|nr:CdaR family protein [Chloroflexota bacterium]